VSIERFRLRNKHNWKSKPGYSICVLNRGQVRFDYPETWNVEPKDDSLLLHDLPPSLESCDLGVSVFPVPGELVRDLPIEDSLRSSLAGERKPDYQSEIHRAERDDLEIVWLEQGHFDVEHKRHARFRVALARGEIICLVSLNYWADRAAILEPVWDEVLRTLVMGVPVDDPTAGPLVQ